MDHQHPAAGHPTPGASPQFLQAAQDLGQRIGLDGHKIAQGHAVDYQGVVFSLAHDGQVDPDGLVLMVHMGQITEPLGKLVCRNMLEHNALAASARTGYFCILPGTDTAAQCLRMDMGRAGDAAGLVINFIASFAHQLERTAALMDKTMNMVRDQMAKEAAP